MTLPIAAIVARPNAERAVLSARPDAPVAGHTPPARRDRLVTPRLALSRVLHRAGDVVAPAAYTPAA